MRKSGSGFRWLGWGVLIVVVVAAAGGVMAYQFGLIGDKRTMIDVNSGDIAVDRTLLGFTFSRTITPTAFSDLARRMGLAGSTPDWRQIMQFSWLSGNNAKFPMSGANSACAGAIWKVHNEQTDADKKQLMGSYMKLLRAGDEKGMETLSQTKGAEQEKRVKAIQGDDERD